MQAKDVERLARSMIGQKLEYLYIKHYLQETYQLDAKLVEQILDKLGMQPPPKPGEKAKPKTDMGGGPPKPNRQGFF